jgi:hypothetical protein
MRAVCICAEAIASYTEWAPVSRIGSSGLLTACCYLVSVPEYSIASLGILRSLCSRRNGGGPNTASQVTLSPKLWGNPYARYVIVLTGFLLSQVLGKEGKNLGLGCTLVRYLEKQHASLGLLRLEEWRRPDHSFSRGALSPQKKRMYDGMYV